MSQGNQFACKELGFGIEKKMAEMVAVPKIKDLCEKLPTQSGVKACE